MRSRYPNEVSAHRQQAEDGTRQSRHPQLPRPLYREQAPYEGYYFDDYYDEEHEDVSPRRLDLGMPPLYDDEDDEYYSRDGRYDYQGRHFGTEGSDDYYRGAPFKKYGGAKQPYGRYDDSAYYARQQPSRAHRVRYEQSYEDPYAPHQRFPQRGRGRGFRGRGIMDEYKSRYGGPSAAARYDYDAYEAERGDSAHAYYDSHVSRRRSAHGSGPAIDYVKAPPYIPGEYYDNDEEYYQAPHGKKTNSAFRMKHSPEESLDRSIGDKKEESVLSRRAERARTRKEAAAELLEKKKQALQRK